MDNKFGGRLEPFENVLARPIDYAKAWQEKHQAHVIGYFCSYTPEEVIFAAGALPLRIFNSADRISVADAHLQAYSCSLIRGALEDALTGKLDVLKGTVFPHTCDSMQRLSDIWRMNSGIDLHFDVVLPVVANSEDARIYMVEVLQKFRRELGKALDTEISEEKLRYAAETYNSIRKLLKRLHDVRIKTSGLLSASDFYRVVKSAMIMDRMELKRALEALVTFLEANATDSPGDEKRIVLAGGFCNLPEVLQSIEAAGGRVITDDFCTGSRYYQGRIDTGGDIVEAIADRYLTRINCPAKHSGLFSRGKYLVNLAKEHQADGVIFVQLKFCDPHAFDYPYIREMLDAEGIPSLMIEMEDRIPSEGQFRTRCEAFMEMLEKKPKA